MNHSTAVILENVEQYSKRRFRYKNEIGILLDAAAERGMQSVFDELAFIGKFIKNAQTILTRDNLDKSVTTRLADEVRINLEKSVRGIAILIENCSPDEKKSITDQFMNISKENVQKLLTLMMELSWFKNFSLDKENT
jgi:hypothetical protein